MTDPHNAELCCSASYKMRAQRALRTALPAAALCYVRRSGEWALTGLSSHCGRWRPARPGTPWQTRPADKHRPQTRPISPLFLTSTASTNAPILRSWIVADAT